MNHPIQFSLPVKKSRSVYQPLRFLGIVAIILVAFLGLAIRSSASRGPHSAGISPGAKIQGVAAAAAAGNPGPALGLHSRLLRTLNQDLPQASTGTGALLTLSGSGADTVNGDYVSDSLGLNAPYHFFVEVPPGLTRIVVEIFDADIGAGGTAEATAGRDRDRNADGFNTTATYSLIDPTGASRPTLFTTGSATLPVGADNAWLALYDSTAFDVEDDFSTVAFTNNDGTNDWSAGWIESDAGGVGPTTGAITVNSGLLHIKDGVSGVPNIQREADLSSTGLNFATAAFSFDYSKTGLLPGDALLVQVSSNGGASYTTLETLTDASTGTSRSYNISAFISANTRVRFMVSTGLNGTGTLNFDNVRISGGTVITPGHWELNVDMSSAVTTGADVNAIGIRANDGTPAGGGTELNIYADSILPLGVNPPASGTASRVYTFYPYVTSGCTCSKNDFDYDSNNGAVGSMSFASRSSAFTQNFASAALSGNDVWRRDNISGWTSDFRSTDDGIWTANLAIDSYLLTGVPNGNYADFYLANSQAAANPPTANPVTNAFRTYLPTDLGTAPAKPYVEQLLSFASVGPNPPVVGQTSRFTVTVRAVNPTAQAITFSSPSNLVTANIPGAGAVYAGTAQVSQGSIVSQPAVGGTGNLTWNPGTLAAGATAILAYRVNVTPTTAGQRLLVTAAVASGNGTRAQWVDETGNTTQTRATYLFGPLCELAVTVGLVTEIELADFSATAYDRGVLFKWDTGFEVNNLGFRLYRDEAGKRLPVSREIIAGSALAVGPGFALGAGRSYQWWDGQANGGAAQAYWLEEIDLWGQSKWHGPYATSFAGGPPPSWDPAVKLSAAGRTTIPSGAGAPVERAAKLKPAVASAPVRLGLPELPALKITVRHEGWYHLAQADLVAAGFDPGTDPARLQMYVDGQQFPIKVLTGTKGRFDANSAVEFYGMGLDNAVTDARVYWLVVGDKPGLRIAATNGMSFPFTAPNFPFTVERKDRTLFFFSLKNGDQENYFGATVSSTPVDQALTVQHLDPAANIPATLEVALQGATFQAHTVRVQVNGADVGMLSYNEQAEGVASLAIAPGLLCEGTNQVTLTATEGDSDISFVDYLRITYGHTFQADNDVLRATVTGRQRVTMGGFSQSAIRVFDVTDPNAVQELSTHTAQPADGFGVWVTPTEPGQRILFAMTADGMKAADGLALNQASNWRSPANSADLIIITQSDLLPSLAPLKALRESQGLSVAVVDVADLYDEFSYGEKSPQAIRDFLAYAAANWNGPPRFVLLAGSASRDPKNYLGFGDLDLVPTKTIDTSSMETASDDWFVDFDGDGVPELPIGRLPARNAEQLAGLVAKIVGYEPGKPINGVLLFADRAADFDFAAASAQLSALLPPQFTVTPIDRDEVDAATARTQLLDAIGSGQKVVNYNGHGSATIWKDFVFTADDAANLNNGDQLPLFVMMTCLNGYFVDPSSYSLAESLIDNSHGGAIGVWASSGISSPADQAQMNQQLFELLFSGKYPPMTLGEAAVRAKQNVNDPDVRRTWILFGDPTTRLR